MTTPNHQAAALLAQISFNEAQRIRQDGFPDNPKWDAAKTKVADHIESRARGGYTEAFLGTVEGAPNAVSVLTFVDTFLHEIRVKFPDHKDVFLGLVVVNALAEAQLEITKQAMITGRKEALEKLLKGGLKPVLEKLLGEDEDDDDSPCDCPACNPLKGGRVNPGTNSDGLSS